MDKTIGMKHLIIVPFLFLVHVSLGQTKPEVDFQKDVFSVSTSIDGKKLYIKSDEWHPRAYGPYVRDYLIYDFELKSLRFFPESGPFGGFSPRGKYFLNTKLRYVDMKRAPYRSKLLNLETGDEQVWENEHFALAVYDDGKVLAAKAKNRKSMARVEKLSTLYLHDPRGGKPKVLIGKKDPLAKPTYVSSSGVEADRHFFHLLSPDNLSSWGGSLYNEHYSSTVFNWYDFTDGSKKEVRFKFPGDTTSLPSNAILAVNGQNAILRRGSRKNKGQWLDYFVSGESGEKQGIGNQDTHTKPAQYQMVENRVYQFDQAGTIVTRFEIKSGGVVSDRVWYPKIPRAILNAESYKYRIASDKYLIAVPSKRTGKVADVIIYDLDNDAVVDNFSLYQKDKPKKVASSYSTKKLYKSDLLNNYDRLSLPYTLYNPSGREVTGMAGASNIGGGQVFAIGMIGTTARGNPILLSLTRYKASNGSVVSTYYVSVFDENGAYKGGRKIGSVERSSAGRTYAVVNFKIQREPYNTFSIVGEQQFEQRKTPFKLTIEPSGNIH